MLCNRLVSDGEPAWEKGDTEEYGRVMVKVKWGQPRNKGLLRAMEDPEKRKIIDKTELSFYAEHMKEEKFKLQDELFFTIDERQHEADLTEQGRNYMNPDDPDAFVLPDLITQFADIDIHGCRQAQTRGESGGAGAWLSRARRSTTFQLLRAYCLYERLRMSSRGKDHNRRDYEPEMTGRRWSDGLNGARSGKRRDIDRRPDSPRSHPEYFRLYESSRA